MDFTKYEMLNRAQKAFGDLGDDEELGPVDWPTVKRYIASLSNLEGESVHPHNSDETDGSLDPMNLKDIRIRLLNGEFNIHLTRCPADVVISLVFSFHGISSRECSSIKRTLKLELLIALLCAAFSKF